MSYSFSENQWGEKYIEELNRTDFTGMQSADFFDRVLEYDLERENTLYLLIGSDSGLLLKYLKQKSLGRGSRVAVIEHDDVYPLIAAEYRGLLLTGDTSTSNDKQTITLHKHSQWREEVFDGSDKPWLLAGMVRVIESNASATDYQHLYMPILRATKQATQERVANISVAMNRSVFSQMQFRNAVDNKSPLKINTEFGDGKTAIVLGGGPSLDLHLEWIKSNRDRLFIVAVSRINNKLVTHDLKPDLLVSVDPYDFSYEICKSGLLWTDVPLVYTFHVSPKLLQQWQGPTYYLGKRLPWHHNVQLEGCVPAAGPTVSHAAVVAVWKLGFSKILMTGIDFCFSSSASTHADDSPEKMIQQMPSLCDARIETYSGRIAGTSVALAQSAFTLNDIGKVVNQEKTVLYNLSEEAARCESVPYENFQNFKLPGRKPDISTHLSLEPRFISPNELDELETELKRAKHAMNKMRMLCTEARTCVKRIHDPDISAKAQKNSIKLTRLRKQLESEYAEYLEAIIYADGIAFDKAKTPTDFKDMSVNELVDWGCHYYDLIDKGAKEMIDLIDSVSPRISIRRDEINPETNVRDLAKRWRADDTPGRILLMKRLKWKSIKAEDRAWVQRAIGKFRSTLNEPANLVKKKLLGRNENINHVMKSLIFLRENNSSDELLAIESKLSATQWPYAALKPFTAGLAMEVQNDTNAAVACFQQSIDVCNDQLDIDADSGSSMQRLVEECLVRMTQCYISTEDYESALATLGMLCEMLPSYVISYAKMLNMFGQPQFAIDLLDAYIELYPTEKKAHFVLSQIRAADSATAPTSENIENPGNSAKTSQNVDNTSEIMSARKADEKTKAKADDDTEDPVYIEKIDGAMRAIMGG